MYSSKLYCECSDELINKCKIKLEGEYFRVCTNCFNFYTESGKEFESKEKFQKVFFKNKKLKAFNLYSSNPFINKKKIKFYKNNVYYLFDYIPLNKCNTKKEKEIQKAIFELKSNHNLALEGILPEFQKLFKKDIEIVISVFPSSQKGFNNSPIAEVGRELCEGNIIDGTRCIFRNQRVWKKHQGAWRSVEKELETIDIIDEHLINDKLVVLLDDITTSGDSFKAGTELLKKYGAKDVFCLAIAKTMKK